MYSFTIKKQNYSDGQYYLVCNDKATGKKYYLGKGGIVYDSNYMISYENIIFDSKEEAANTRDSYKKKNLELENIEFEIDASEVQTIDLA